MTVNTITANSYDKILLKATVASGSVYVPNGLIAFKINNKTIGHANVTNGKASLSYTLPGYSAGTYTISTVYGGTSSYSSTTASNTLKVKEDPSVITIKNITTTKGSTVRLLAVVKTSTGSYAHGGTVAFKLNGITIGTSKVVNGGAAINYTVPTSLSKSSYKISTVYSGTKASKSASSTSTLTIKAPQTTIVTTNNITSKNGSTVRLLAVVKTSNGSYAYGGTVAFKLNGITIGTSKVVNGGAAINYTIPKTYTKSSYTITVVYGGNNNYKASNTTATLKLNITKPATTTSTNSNVNKTITSNSSLSQYLKATTNCQVTSSTIQNLAKTITAGYTTTLGKAKAIFNYLNSKTGYSYYANTKYGAVKTWNNRKGNCVDLAHLLIAVCRASNIPARYAHATCYFRSGLVTGHVWAEVYVDGKWYSCDLTSSSNSFGKIVNWNKHGSIKRYTSLPF